jgi:molecular chaperone HscB
MNYFEVFELPRRLAIDAGDLQRRFYELSRRHHPDFHQTATPADQAAALERSALVNAAYRHLRDPVARAEYLVQLEEGRPSREGGRERPKAPPELLAEMFEIQEALQDAKLGGLDEATRAGLVSTRDALAERQQADEREVAGRLSAELDAAIGDGRRVALEALKQALARRAYLRTVIDDLSAAIGEGEGE